MNSAISVWPLPKISMRVIKRDNRHQTFFSTFDEQVSNDYATRLMDVYQFFPALDEDKLVESLFFFMIQVKIYLPEVDTCTGACRRRRWPHNYCNICNEAKHLMVWKKIVGAKLQDASQSCQFYSTLFLKSVLQNTGCFNHFVFLNYYYGIH